MDESKGNSVSIRSSSSNDGRVEGGENGELEDCVDGFEVWCGHPYSN